MKGWSNAGIKGKVLLVILLIIGLSLGFYFFMYKPQVEKLESNKEKIEKIKDEIRDKRSILRDKKKLMHSYKNLQDMLGYSNNIMYKNDILTSGETVNLVVDLNKMAMISNVNLITLKAKGIREGDIYYRFPVEMKARGRYEQILDYIKNIKENNYLTRIRRLNINSPLLPVDEVEVKIDLVGYTLNNNKGGEGDVSETQVQ